jgi:hypothetical protein
MFLRRVLAWRVELLHVRTGGTDCLGLRSREIRVPFGAGVGCWPAANRKSACRF